MNPTPLWGELRRQDIAEAARNGGVVIQPLGSIEQHGPHLPLNTDINSSYSVAYEAAQRVRDFPVLVSPPIWWGLCPQHMVSPGTITLRQQTLLALLTDICSSILAHGFRKIVVLNGHGGNAGLIHAAAIELTSQGIPIAVLSYWNLIPEQVASVCATDRFEGHAGEFETSLQLHLQPGLVASELISPEIAGATVSPVKRGVLASGYISLDLDRDAPHGVVGDPTAGTAHNGEILFEAAVAALVTYVRAYRGI